MLLLESLSSLAADGSSDCLLLKCKRCTAVALLEVCGPIYEK